MIEATHTASTFVVLGSGNLICDRLGIVHIAICILSAALIADRATIGIAIIVIAVALVVAALAIVALTARGLIDSGLIGTRRVAFNRRSRRRTSLVPCWSRIAADAVAEPCWRTGLVPSRRRIATLTVAKGFRGRSIAALAIAESLGRCGVAAFTVADCWLLAWRLCQCDLRCTEKIS